MSSLVEEPTPFGEWLPDHPALNNPGVVLAKNVIPQVGGYGEFRDLNTFTDALTAACVGAFWTQDDSNTVFNFAGDAAALYRLDSNTTWTDVSKGGGYTSVDNWEFVKFGERVAAFAAGNPPQYYDMGVSSQFADLPGSPPQAKRAAVVGDFIVLGDLDAYGPNVIAWGGFNSSELWTPSVATQSDRQTLFGRGGRVQRIVPGATGIIFQEHSIRAIRYVGPPLIFDQAEIESQHGTPAPNSVCWSKSQVFYLGHDGFNTFTLAGKSKPIGVNRVDKWFNREVGSDTLEHVRGVVDRRNRLVLWGFRTSSALTYNNRLLIYNWALDRWAYAEVDTQVLSEFVSSGYTVDTLDSITTGGIDGTWANLPVDTDAFSGGLLGLQAFSSDNKSATFDGTPLQACIEGPERGGRRAKQYTNAQRPVVEGTSAQVSVQIGYREKPTANVTLTPAVTLNQNDETRIRRRARYLRERYLISGGFDNALGAHAHKQAAGGN